MKSGKPAYFLALFVVVLLIILDNCYLFKLSTKNSPTNNLINENSNLKKELEQETEEANKLREKINQLNEVLK
jgi:Tfp pilus assembly protein PilO